MSKASLLSLLLAALLVPCTAAARSVDESVEALRSAAPGAPRLEAAAALAALGEAAVPELIQRLAAPRVSTDDQRRAVLQGIGADLPNKKGEFKAVKVNAKAKAPPELDWLAALADRPADPALLDVVEVTAIIRALAGSHTRAATAALLDLAFVPDGYAFRDECGRYIRRTSPYSLAALIVASQDKDRAKGAYGRYASYQLDRLGKGRPSQALAAAPDDAVEIAILQAIGDVKHPDAVPVVLARADAASPGVREAARAAFLAYVTGPPPPEAPKAKRKLPGGKLSEEELPLYLTYRELADAELRRVLEELDGQPPAKKAKPDEMAAMVFARFDARRAAAWEATMTEVNALVAAGKWTEAAAGYDVILDAEPLYPRRAEMAPAFAEVGALDGNAGRWAEAARRYNQALTVDPTGPRAREIEGKLFHARAEAARLAGRAAGPDVARALAADPGLGAARTTAAEVRRDEARGARRWMLWAGGALILVAAAAFLLGRRRGEAAS